MEDKTFLNGPPSYITETTPNKSNQAAVQISVPDETQHPTPLLNNANPRPPSSAPRPKCVPIRLQKQPTFDTIEVTPRAPVSKWVGCVNLMRPYMGFGLFVLAFIVFLAALFTLITKTAHI